MKKCNFKKTRKAVAGEADGCKIIETERSSNERFGDRPLCGTDIISNCHQDASVSALLFMSCSQYRTVASHVSVDLSPSTDGLVECQEETDLNSAVCENDIADCIVGCAFQMSDPEYNTISGPSVKCLYTLQTWFC